MIPFAAYTAAKVTVLFSGPDNPQKFPFSHLIHGSFGPHESATQNISIGRFCGAQNVINRHTQTDHATPSVAMGASIAAIWPNNNNIDDNVIYSAHSGKLESEAFVLLVDVDIYCTPVTRGFHP